MELFQEVFKVPKGVETPCLMLPDLFQNKDLEPDIVDWLMSDEEVKKDVAFKKKEAESLAVRACNFCPVQKSCKEWFEDKDVYGVVGGLTKGERLKLTNPNSPKVSFQDWDPVDHYLNTEYLSNIYEYVDALMRKEKLSVVEVSNLLSMSEGEVADILKVNQFISPNARIKNKELWVKKLLNSGLSHKLISERLDVSDYFIRSVKKNKDTSRKKGVEKYIEENYNIRWGRFARPTKLVYDFLAVSSKTHLNSANGATTSACGEGLYTRKEIFETVNPELSHKDKLRGAQKGRSFTTEAAKLESGARRSINHALLLGVRLGILEIRNVETCGEGNCPRVKHLDNKNLPQCEGGLVDVYKFNEEFLDKWLTYRYKKIKENPSRWESSFDLEVVYEDA